MLIVIITREIFYIMLGLLVFSCLLAASLANPTVSDCATGDSSVKIYSISMSPYPPKFEAELTFSVEAEILKTVNNFHINLEIKKRILGIPIPIPCIDGIGSCMYGDICARLDAEFPNECPPEMVEEGIPCKCPFEAQKFSYKDVTVVLPALPDGIGGLVSGNYDVTAQLIDAATNGVISCTLIKLQLA